MLVRMIKYVRFMLPFACVALLVAGTAAPSLAALINVVENFDTAPTTWTGINNRTSPQDFGWSNTNNAGGPAGEIGGTFSRNTLGRYDTGAYAADISSDSLTLTGRGRFSESTGDGNAFLAWYSSSTSLDWVPDNYLGLRTDVDWAGGSAPRYNTVLLEYVANGGQFHTVKVASDLGHAGTWSFSLGYDPAANSGNGAITASVNGGTPVVLNLDAGDKDAMASLDRFGLMTLNNGGSDVKGVYFDSLGQVPEPGMITILATGLISLLAYAWKKRK